MSLKFITISICLAAGLGAFGCAVDSQAPEEETVAETEQAVSDNACRWRCNTCRPGMACIQVCESIGNCGNRCNVLAYCVEGYEWDENSCQCKPSAGETCGSVTCPSGMVCCNESCGICTEPGGFCTEQYCTAY